MHSSILVPVGLLCC